jgi:hypothetical protein
VGTPAANPTNAVDNGLFSDSKNFVIVVLIVLVILSFIGVNMLVLSGNILEEIAKIFGPIFRNLLAMLGFSTGELINDTAVVATGGKFGIDIAHGTAQSVGNLLKNASQGGMDESQRKNLERALKSPKCDSDMDAAPVSSTNSIVSKGDWCYIGEYQGTRGCVAMTEHNKCMSGQVFPSQAACLQQTPEHFTNRCPLN